MTFKLLCNFSANDTDFPFTVGKVYTPTDETKGFNKLSCHILCDNGKSVKVETVNILVNGKVKWVVKDFRNYSTYNHYSSFEIV